MAVVSSGTGSASGCSTACRNAAAACRNEPGATRTSRSRRRNPGSASLTMNRSKRAPTSLISSAARMPRALSITSPYVGPSGSQMWGARAPSVVAAARVPASSPPTTASVGLGSVSSHTTTPMPGSRSTPMRPRGICILRSPASPITIGTPSPAFVRGRFMADVSNPKRAATLAAAATSASLGGSPSIRWASTKSMCPSPLRSWRIGPSSKIASRPGTSRSCS